MPTSDVHDGARIFISYALKDGAAFAACLRKQLIDEGFSVWQDLIAIEGGRDWWSQIEDALRAKSLQHFVLVATPGALESEVVGRERRLARQEGKTVSPVRGPGLPGFHALPRWLGEVYDLAIPEKRRLFIRVLQGPSSQKRAPMTAPKPPADFVARPVEFNALKQQLLEANGDVRTTTAALRGPGGYGKTTLAAALAHDEDIRDAYFDGILWVTLGEKPVDLLSIISDQITFLSGERPGLETVPAAGAKLGETLGDRRILLVIDDVWREQDLQPFLQGGSHTTRLITTRNDHLLPDTAARQQVDEMQKPEALALLSAGLPQDQVAGLRVELAALAARLGEWAQLLKIINGVLRGRTVKKEPLAQAIVSVDRRLTKKGLREFDAKSAADRTRTIAYTIKVSLDALDRAGQERFGELGVFPEDVDVPLGVVTRLWDHTGGIDADATEDLSIELGALSLLHELDLERRTLRLHDNVRRFLREQAGDALAGQSQALVRVLQRNGNLEDDPLSLRYYYLYLPRHLHEAVDSGELHRLLLDPAWLKAKLAATGSPQALVADYDQYSSCEAHRLIGRTLRLTLGICARDPRQLLLQLAGRLMASREAYIADFVAAARSQVTAPTLLPYLPGLKPPGAESARLEGHTSSITALCVLPDGRLASGSNDDMILVWDVTTGDRSARLDVHSDAVTALCVLRDGRLALAAEDDDTIRLLDMETDIGNTRLEGHSGTVRALCVLPDGRLASGADDNMILLWDVTTGIESKRLEGHTDTVRALCVLPDGRLATGAGDKTIRLWDLTTARSAQLEGHTNSVSALCLLPDGRLASAADYDTIRVWDVMTGANTQLEDTDLTVALCALPDGRLASGSDDKTIRLWEVKASGGRRELEEDSDPFHAPCLLPDGRLALAAKDDTIRLFDVKTGAESAKFESSSPVNELCVLPDGRLALACDDSTIRLWDMKTGVESVRLEGHTDPISALCVLPDGRLASGAYDNTIRLWDLKTGVESLRLEGHSESLTALCALADGRLASASSDDTIRLWNVKTGAESARLEGCTGWWVYALCLLPDGRLALAAEDQTIRVWDVKTRAESAGFKGHIGGVRALSVLPDGRLASGSYDNTIRVWNVKTCKEICRLEVDAPVQCLATLPDGRLVAGDRIGRLHWLELIE